MNPYTQAGKSAISIFLVPHEIGDAEHPVSEKSSRYERYPEKSTPQIAITNIIQRVVLCDIVGDD